MNRRRARPSQPPQPGQTDLLLRLFDSQFFDAWLALTYIYQNKSGGVHDYLCNKLYELPEQDIERFLSQFCQLIVTRPGSALERVIVDLCARSLRIAVKVYWLFKAIYQDNLKNLHARDMMDRCEMAALNGCWELPFKSCTLDPLSPREATTVPSTPVCTSTTPRSQKLTSMDDIDTSTISHPDHLLEELSSCDISQTYLFPGGYQQNSCSSRSAEQSQDNMPGGSPACSKPHIFGAAGPQELQDSVLQGLDDGGPEEYERCKVLHAELGDGEGVTALLARSQKDVQEGGTGCLSATENEPLPPPSSPRLRKTTFGATLDFVEALCNASSSLVHIPQDMRKKALCRALMDINAEIELCSQKNVAVWCPMGSKNQRVLRLVADDAIILNSREKVPFMLFIEVLESDNGNEDGEASEAEQYADSAHSIVHARSDSQANSGTGATYFHEPFGTQADHQHSAPGLRRDPTEAGNQVGKGPGSHSGRTLSESSAWKGDLPADPESDSSRHLETTPRSGPTGVGGIKPPTVPVHSNSSLSPEAVKELRRIGVGGVTDRKNSFTRRIDTAMAGLRGDVPLVKLKLKVLGDSHGGEEEARPVTRENSEDILPPQASSSAAPALGQKEDESLASSRALAILSKLGFCRNACLDLGISEEWYKREKTQKQHISVSLEVIGGVNLRIPSPAKRRRVPSHEALEYLADKMNVANLPDPAAQFGLDMESRTCSERSETSSRLSFTLLARNIPMDDHVVLRNQKKANEVYGQRWHEKVESIRRQSPHGRRRGWSCKCVIVKSGDDCRQELLAIQLIETFQDIFHEAQLPLWVRPYEVLVTSNRTALIEFIPDTLSIHSIKHKSPPGTSLSQHFFNKFRRGTPECAKAQRAFVESLAAYSIISYLLQFKDRHNGNLLVDDKGRLIHIDFGFMLGVSPGGVNFEAAPFKLTREFLEIMDSNSEGKASEHFDYFKVLFIQGFLACRKHADRIVNLCEMMSKTGFPCFKTGERTIKNLKKRFHLNCPEDQSIQVVIGLTSDSLDAWRTRQYDYYQRVLNGIL